MDSKIPHEKFSSATFSANATFLQVRDSFHINDECPPKTLRS
jgi:hypothetical protein